MNTEVHNRITEIEHMMNEPGFWSDFNRSNSIMKEYNLLQNSDTGTDSIDFDPIDSSSAVVNILAGAGGDDSEDFVRMLYDMYCAFARRKSFDVTVKNESKNQMNGYRSISFIIQGLQAYAEMEFESGVHRLIRLSPFNAKQKRQTSFALVEVLPLLSPQIGSEIKKEDCEILFQKSGGPGGQNVNKRETAVRVTHIPTGVSVLCDTERSQESNKQEALDLIRAKVTVLERAKYKKDIDDMSISKTVENEWGSQIRTYTLHPYQLIKDTRTGSETTSVDKVMNKGEIELLR